MKGLRELLDVVGRLEGEVELKVIGAENRGKQFEVEWPSNAKRLAAVPREALVSHYRQADVFINFSYSDSWGQTVLEAMACGTPVIVSDNTGAKDALRDGGGVVVKTGDSEALEHCIVSLHRDREKLASLAQEAGRFVYGHLIRPGSAVS
ncbi:MAG: glycosyltransferase [Pseudomonadales bacterium]|nr:glycosyltransferase [Pseudomonadales bacterium]